jgi:hypothetical protein
MAEQVNAKVYKVGPDEQVVDNGGLITVKAGGKVDLAAAGQSGIVLPTVADKNTSGQLLETHRITVADGATADIDVVVDHKIRVIDVVVIKTVAAGGAGDAITVKNGATAITDAIDINAADKTVKRAGTIDDAQYEIAAGGTLRVTRTKASANNVACEVVVYALKVA